jgi:predicted transglutaminase-like cysteine proteinase
LTGHAVDPKGVLMRISLAISILTTILTIVPQESFAGSMLRPSRSIGAPIGFPSACARYAWLCHNRAGGQISDDQAMSMIKRINRQVNAAVTPATDFTTTRKAEYWSLPIANKGDCEDYALLKMKTLLHAGFPSNRLSMSVVIDRNGGNHVVLLARLESGDYVLDNLAGSVKLWSSTGYTFLASQNFNSKSSWQVTLAGPRAGQFSGT